MKTFSLHAAVLCLAALLVGPVQAHDPVAGEMARAANLFLAALDDEQKGEAAFDWKSDQRENWHFVPDRFIDGAQMRYGLPIKKMTARQRVLAHGLLSTGLSHKGYLQATTIMTLEQILHDLENQNPIRNPDLYYVSIFGTPSIDSTWSWRFEGHHLSLNFTLVNGHLYCVTPSFFGTNPGRVKAGAFKDLQVLKEEENLARELAQSLSAQQRQLAILQGETPKDIITGQERKADKGKFFPPQGIPYSNLNGSQKQRLLQLINVYASKYRDEILDQINARTKIDDTQQLYFAWAGGTEPGQGHYYRIQTQRFLFEYDNTQNDANHIHAVWREFDGDFGADLLRQHYEAHH